MSKSKVGRKVLMGSAAAVALFGAASAAQAVEAKFGDVQIIFDTTVSMGVSMRTAETDSQFLPESNGGPVDPRSGPGDSNVVVSELGLLSPSGASTGNILWTNNTPNFDGSINSDDGRLNFGAGDLIGATAKANHDLQITWRNYTVFARAVGFYDVVMNDHDAGNRSQLTDAALGDVGRNYDLLDLFISADYTVADMPVNLRVGKQVINWGESTFILHGNNAFNPIDVAAFRRPGSEIKEALVPVNAVSGSISLPFDVSLSGYYALDWEPFELDPSGTPFSSSDVVALGTGLGGNEGRVSFLSGSPLVGPRRICDGGVADGNAVGLATVYGLGLLPNPLVATPGVIDCFDSPFVDNTVPYTLGNAELDRFNLVRNLSGEGFTRVTSGMVSRDDDIFARDDGQWGVSARWYAESLGGTEFGFYYQNYHSRLPFASERAGSTMDVAVSPISHSTQLSSAAAQLATPTGCLIDANPGAFADPRISTALLGNVALNDPQNLLNPVSLGTAFALTGANGGVVYNSPIAGTDNLYNAAVLQCALILFQSGLSPTAGTALGLAAAPALFNGAEILTYASDIGLFIEYPEDIEMLGFSFNTTLWGWGVQGDFSYRQNAPFQVDTDSLVIAAAMEQCAFTSVGDLMSTFEALGTVPGHTCFSGGTVGGENISGVIRNQMYTAQVGTTATFTGSDWWVDALGGDLGILVTEVGMVYVPNVEDTWIDKTGTANLANQYQNIGCNGSDLPLGGLLGLDAKTSEQCRPTDVSAGLVLLGRLDYNNAFNSGWQISPQLVYTWDFVGVTPSPYGNYIEDRQSVGVSVTGTLNNNLRLGASYSNFFGGHVQNKAKDTDFASVTASYTF